MSIEQILKQAAAEAIKALYGAHISEDKIPLQATRPDLEGDYTIVVFGFAGMAKASPEATAQAIGEKMQSAEPQLIRSIGVLKGFLNITLGDAYFLNGLQQVAQTERYGFVPISSASDTVVLEYSAPNTNKPLHLGHIRNNLLGWAVAELLKANGKDVKKVNLINDRGIHICKSMLAWQKWGEGATPASTHTKGDKFVGNYYVLFDKKYKEEIKALEADGVPADDAKKQAPLLLAAQAMLKKWEQGDKDIIDLWTTMNGWVYEGFDQTYAQMGVDFDKVYYESDTYLLGKQMVEEGLANKVLIKREDGSVWCDLQAEGLDEKLLLRPDGTSVYMTQDLGTANLRYQDYAPQEMMYVVGNEQNYHFDVLKIILKKLGKAWADNIHHLSYGMVELPHGKMKSREGTVVDADDLMQEMYDTAKATTEALGKIDDFTPQEADTLYKNISLGALKYFILKVDPKKQMMFNPAESIDFNGNTGPFIQYTYARIQSILRKSAMDISREQVQAMDTSLVLHAKEKALLTALLKYPLVIKQAGAAYSPGVLANYIFDLVKTYNRFYQDISILKEEDADLKLFRVLLSREVAKVIASALGILGIQVPERM